MHNIIHIYMYINNIVYTEVLLHVSIHLHLLQGILSFYFGQVTKTCNFTQLEG